ncbi:unnamed protein product [Phytophthora fragariaefolia]|uniref:Unnamed protein product n=1 Tax=Phytophthora fragariaefolia TaxID=1490495 RepID=A0A9W6U836_9STRA|nr:unnamed protein product [Phytophthora fragariaefolia]
MEAVSILEEEADEELLERCGNGALQRFLDNEAFSSPAQELTDLLVLVESRRYLEGHGRLPKNIEFRESGIQSLTPKDFRQTTRVNHASFFRILANIESNDVFHNNSDCGQAPVWLKLASSFSFKDLRTNCVGFIDGTSIPLSQKPAVDGACYVDRKHRYSVNAQVVCDDRRRIIAFYSDWPGSSADSTVYKEMAIAKAECKPYFISQGEYLIADSAYPADVEYNTLVPAYKANMKGLDNEDFNTCVAHVRVVNEHTIGVLKGRWSSLKELRIQIRKKTDMERITLWFTGCVVLHNMLIAFEDEWTDEYLSDSDSDSEDELYDANSGWDDYEFDFRRNLKRRVIAIASEPGGILWARGRSVNQ